MYLSCRLFFCVNTKKGIEMIKITRKDNKNVQARILNADKFTLKQLNEIYNFWSASGKYDVEIIKE